MKGPLDGLVVLDFSRLLPGGYATLVLADLGADVIKVEEPGRGDYIRWMPPMAGEHSAAHVALNRNKRSIALNLKTVRGRDLCARLARESDIVVESFRPGVMDRLGLGYEVLSAGNPGLVYCAITGYGQDGPRARVAGHDLNYLGYAGVLSITGGRDGPPIVPGVQMADFAGGAMAAVIAIQAALIRRAATGRGDFCDVAMTDVVVSWLSVHAGAFFATGRVPGRESEPLNGGVPCYRIYPAADGWITVGALEPQFWAQLCDALGRPDLSGDAYATGARGGEVIADLEALFATRTRAEWMELLAGRDVSVGPVNDFAETFRDEQVAARNMVIDHGGWRHIASPIRLSSSDRELVRLPPPHLGEHTQQVLAALGVGEREMRTLRAEGVC